MLRPPLQGLKNEHVQCSLQQLNPVLILVFFAHRCRYPTPNGGRLSTSASSGDAQNRADGRYLEWPPASHFCNQDEWLRAWLGRYTRGVMAHRCWDESYASGELPWDTGEPEP